MKSSTLAACRWESSPRPQYETSARFAARANALIFFTDGVVEAFDENGQEFAMAAGWPRFAGFRKLAVKSRCNF